ncbi:hypothetical protein AFLA_012823 [Aspergillus flavus NRRL3357]|nr:hypothetical protein AFLA_012823 [Aspergillus flavus NRRL3357]
MMYIPAFVAASVVESVMEHAPSASFHNSRNLRLSHQEAATLAAIEKRWHHFLQCLQRPIKIIDETDDIIRDYHVVDNTPRGSPLNQTRDWDTGGDLELAGEVQDEKNCSTSSQDHIFPRPGSNLY